MVLSQLRYRDLFCLVAPLLCGIVLQGCVATRNWVTEQITPISSRVSSAEGRLGQTEGRLSGAEGRLAEVDAKAEKALSSLANLRLQRRFVLDLKEGANFAFNSAALTDQAKNEINSFLSDLKGDLKEMEGAVFLIAGHTDAAGPDNYNYELGRKRAESVARHLITESKLDPLRVVTASYGKSAPLADNSTPDGRKKNRRVEILVYSEGITTAAAAPTAQADPFRSQLPGEQVSSR